MAKKVLLFLILILAACKKEAPPPSQNDFQALMGKGLAAWQHVQTQEDRENLQIFENLFLKNKPLMQTPSALVAGIPKVLHFIWLGPRNFPLESIENIKSWISHNPEWKVFYWSDRERPLPHPAMELHLIHDFPFLKMKDFFYLTENYAEKSDLLRYEILFQQGGVYVDHDVTCLRAFDALNDGFDFYCGLEMPSATPLSSSVHTTNNLIGSVPGHPIIEHCMQWLEGNWDRIEKSYPGIDKEAVILRVANRTFSAFSDAVKRWAPHEDKKNIVLPAFYFNAPDMGKALWARHHYAGMWFENETPFEKMARQRLMILSKKANKNLLFCGIAFSLNLIGFLFLFIQLRRKTNKTI